MNYGLLVSDGMPLPNDYASQSCSVARSLEIVGERWTMLIVRDAFYGVRRFGDFVTHLDIPRAVLAARLKNLVAEGVMVREPGAGGHDEYALTEKGRRLWPVMRELMAWGDQYYAPRGPRRVLTHAADGGNARRRRPVHAVRRRGAGRRHRRRPRPRV